MHILSQNPSAGSSTTGTSVIDAAAKAPPTSASAPTASGITKPAPTTQLETQLAQITRLAPRQQTLEARLLKTGQLIQLQLSGSTQLSSQPTSEGSRLGLLLSQAADLLRSQTGRLPAQTATTAQLNGNPIKAQLSGQAILNERGPQVRPPQVFLQNRITGTGLIQPGQLISVVKAESGYQIGSSNNGVNQHLMRLLLPNDKPLNKSLSDLLTAAQPGRSAAVNQNSAPLPGNNILASILKIIPRSQDLSADNIRHAFSHSGLPSNQSSGVSLGTLLLTLIKQLKVASEVAGATSPAMAESVATANNMRALATDALAKILFNQLRPILDSTGDGAENRRLDFLVRHEDSLNVFDLGINKQVPPPEEKEDKQHDDTDRTTARRWDVNLNFELEKLGQITANLRFTEGISLMLTLWAVDPAPFELLNRHAKGFKQNLGESLTHITGEKITTKDEFPDKNRNEESRGGHRPGEVQQNAIAISLEVINRAHPEPKISFGSQLVDLKA
jgi:hypothetical protein